MQAGTAPNGKQEVSETMESLRSGGQLGWKKSGGRHRPPFLAKWRRNEKQNLFVLTFHTHFKVLDSLKKIPCHANQIVIKTAFFPRRLKVHMRLKD